VFGSSEGFGERRLLSGSKFEGHAAGLTIGVCCFVALCAALVIAFLKRRGSPTVSEYSEKEMHEDTTHTAGVWDSVVEDPDDALMTELNILTAAGGAITTDLWVCE
jgi:hypothetical protein